MLLDSFSKHLFKEGVFSDCWKKSDVVAIGKKESKNLLKQ